mmetsp:Transcript_61526/g.133150  ORF Transcript_61526/g.133150 Transcript_61526/m.133150 type:complete len:235 (+) Transcript_61526:474-1178(+)
MAQGDGAAVDVQARDVAASDSPGPCQRHRREGLVDLNQVQILDCQASLLENRLCGRDGTIQHSDGIGPGEAQRDNPGTWFQLQLLEAALVADEDCRGTIADLRSRCSRENATLEDGLELRHGFEVRTGSNALVDLVHLGRGLALDLLARNLHDVSCELPRLGRRVSQLMAADGVGVCIGSRDPVLLSDQLRTHELVELGRIGSQRRVHFLHPSSVVLGNALALMGPSGPGCIHV